MRLRTSQFAADCRRLWVHLEAPLIALLVFTGMCASLYLILNFYPEV